ncbi:MAG: ABC transporter ATP-binding protein [Planctomycetes bacterium]|nr:ABC transporter ATP-binding protein [Planctomycetota bacterium]
MSNRSKQPIIQTVGLEKSYRIKGGRIPVLHGIDLTVQAGEFVAVCGPSGCGKSTLLRLLAGLDRADSGSIRVDGDELTEVGDARRTAIRREKIGFVFQRFNLLPALSALANVRLALRIKGRPKGDGAAAVLAQMGLKEKLDRKPMALSMGEQQRVAIARAVAHRPKLLFADEPTGNLDSKNAEEVLGIFRSLNQESGQTIVMITHNTEAARVADRIVRMRDGRLADGGA